AGRQKRRSALLPGTTSGSRHGAGVGVAATHASRHVWKASRQSMSAVLLVLRQSGPQVRRAVIASKHACEARSPAQALCAAEISVPHAAEMHVSALESAVSSQVRSVLGQSA